MALEINDFKNYTDYPMGLCKNFRDGSQKENMLAYMLSKTIEADNMEAVVETEHTHPTMVQDGLLEEVAPKQYKITLKAYALIYGHQVENPNKVA